MEQFSQQLFDQLIINFHSSMRSVCLWCVRNVMHHSQRPVSWWDTWDIVTRTRSLTAAPSATTRRWNWASWGVTFVHTPGNVRTSASTALTPAPTRTNSNDISEFTRERSHMSATYVTCDSLRATVSRWAVNASVYSTSWRVIDFSGTLFMPWGPRCFRWTVESPSGPMAFEAFDFLIAAAVCSVVNDGASVLLMCCSRRRMRRVSLLLFCGTGCLWCIYCFILFLSLFIYL